MAGRVDVSNNPLETARFPVLSGPSSCCSPAPQRAIPVRADLDQAFVTGSYTTASGPVPQVESHWISRDWWGLVKARSGINRMNYAVDPGLYALGTPDEDAPVLASANYKLSFDILRKSLGDRRAWILVLDTKGINVWCAAGKGTFGTDELVRLIENSGIKTAVRHRKVIVPQLGAPGVSAREVKGRTGFQVHYGPVNAADLPAYLDAGLVAEPRARRISFGLKDRAVLIPIELAEAGKPLIGIAAVFMVVAAMAGYLAGSGGFLDALVKDGFFAVAALAAAMFAGAVLHPLLLPYLPGRAFSMKGMIIGLATAALVVYGRGIDPGTLQGIMEMLAWLLIIPALSAFLAMNFTGCSTYTSLSGVKKEMRYALPMEIAAGALGCVLWIGSLITPRGF